MFLKSINFKTVSILKQQRQQSFRSYSTLNDSHIQFFQKILPSKNVITDDLQLQTLNCDWTGEFRGSSKLCLQPTKVEELSIIMKYCNENLLPIAFQGGNTGLVGGSIPIGNETIISFTKMNSILQYDEDLSAIISESGVILQQADEYCRAKHNSVMPLDLGSKGSCQLGGNISTNAGGIRLIKFGSLRGNILGLEVVLSDGTVLDSLRTLRKDNVGYDLKQLFIGSEGTLGAITKCSILTYPQPKSTLVTLVGFNQFEHCIKALKMAREHLGSTLSAYEYFDYSCLELVLQYNPTLRNPLSGVAGTTTTNEPYKFYVVIETSSHNDPELSEDRTKMLNLFSKLINEGLAKDAVMSENEKQYQDIWAFRERITSSLKSSKQKVFKYDVSLPVTYLNDCTLYMKSHLREKFRDSVAIFEYGHLGDGNLHFNAKYDVNSGKFDEKLIQSEIESLLYSYVQRRKGSISAEHGLGQLKAKKISFSRSPIEIEWMKQMKRTFDPKMLLNPGKVLV
jgi:D-2-hydroxyglutarate dehydrogenase